MIGQLLDHYWIETQLGAGGMGVVYKGHDLRLQRPVAIKSLSHSTDAARKILSEARAASALNHPHICTIYEVAEVGGQAFIVMEYIEGQTLRDVIPPDGLAVESAVAYAIQIADAIAHAHDHGVIHRDLKSANIVITPEGRTKVLDFGLASRFTTSGTEEISKAATQQEGSTDTAAGTLAYMPPEVLRGKQADARGDIWTLGVVVYEMLTGRLPFTGRNNVELSTEILREPPWPLRASIDAGLRGVVARCLMKEPRQRYQRASEVRSALETIQRELEGSGPLSDRLYPVQVTRPPRVTWKMLLIGTAGLVGLVALSLAIPQTRGLILEITPAERVVASPPTANTEAYNLYLQGTNALRKQPGAEGANAAIHFFEEAVRQDAGFGLAYAATSEALLQRFRHTRDRQSAEQALYMAERAYQLDPERPEAHLALGAAYNALGKGAEAIEPLKRALALSPNSDKAYRELGRAFGVTGRGGEAIQSLHKAVELNAFDPEHYNVLGAVALSLGRYSEAAEAYRRVIEFEPGSVRGYSNLGTVYLQTGEYGEAAAALQKALTLEEHPVTYSNLGLTYANTGRLAEAVQMLQRAVDLDPNEARLVNLADGYRWFGEEEKAGPIYDKAIALASQQLRTNPRDAATLAALAQSYAKKGNAAQAIQLITSARSIKPDDVSFIYYEAIIQLLAGRTAESLALLRTAFQAGYPTAFAQQDPEFRVLRSDPTFQDLMKEFAAEPR